MLTLYRGAFSLRPVINKQPSSMNFRLTLNSLATRLTLLGIVILVAGALGRVYILSDYLRKDVVDLNAAQLLSIANYVAQDVDRDIQERRELLEHVAKTLPPYLLHDRRRAQDWLRVRHEIAPLFSFGISVIDVSGAVLSNYPELSSWGASSYANHDYFQHAMKGEFAIGRPFVELAVRAPVLPMAVPIRGADGRVLAVLAGVSALNSKNFLGSLYSTRVGATGGLLLISPRDKLFVGASDANLTIKPTPEAGINKLHDQAMNGFRGTGITVNARGVEELSAVASVPGSGWFVVARMPSTEVYAPLVSLRKFILRNTTFIVMGFVIILILGLRHVLRPLINAAKHADRMTLGEAPLEPIPVVRNDEVGHLTMAFNRVLSKLLASRTDLEQRIEQVIRAQNEHRQFIAMLAHELRTPLAVIDGAVQSLEYLQPQDEDVRRRHQRIRRSVERINGLVRQFLTNDRIDDPNRLVVHQVPLDGAELARLALQSCSDGASGRVHLRMPDTIPCQGDAALMQVALVNLLDNALKYSPPDKPVEICVEALARGGVPGVAWTVSDQGAGIAPENREAVFGKYVRGADHGNVAGTGLGLYLVRRIAELHGGSVEILEREGWGAVLRFWLPEEGGVACSE